MRQLFVSALDGVRRGQRLWMKLRGATPEGVAERRIVTGEAWDEFCDTLKAAGAELKFPGAPQDLVLELVRERGLDAVVTNPGSLVGPYDFEPSMIGRALLDLYHRRIPILLEVVSDYVDARDVADGILRAAEKGRAGERYLLTGDVLELKDIVALWGELTSVPMPKRVLPLWVGWGMVPFTILAARLTGKSALFTPGVLRASVSNRVVSHAKATDELGFQPRSVKAALAGALEFYRTRGWVDAPVT